MTTEITNCNALHLTERWYSQLVEDCQDIVAETEFTSRWALVEGYHQLGSRILTEYENFQRLRMPDTQLIATVAESLNKKPRTIYYAVQFARLYPDLNLLGEGKNISWHHIVNKYLTDGKEKPIMKKADLMIKEIKQLLQTEWQLSYQITVEANNFVNDLDEHKYRCEFIRYLQDQVEKITGAR